MIEKAVVTPNGIKELLKSYDWPKAISEYIWNGFDANATQVDLSFKANESPLDTIYEIAVSDNGDGISKKDLPRRFRPIYESEKARVSNQPKHHSLPHGRNGKGRLTFFTFAESASWTTTYKEGETFGAQKIKIGSGSLDSYEPEQVDYTKDETGTKVVFEDVSRISTHEIESVLVPYLKREFAWFIELNRSKGICLSINGNALDYKDIIQERDYIEFNKGLTGKRFEVSFVLWKTKLNSEYSKYYYLDGDKNEVWKENTTLNNKGDNFHHSVYINSSYFSDFYWSIEDSSDGQEELVKSRKDAVFKDLSERLTKFLFEKRSPFIDSYTEKLVKEYESEKIFPDHGKSPVGQYQNSQIKETVKELYKVQPKIFTSLNVTQKKTFVNLLDALIDLGADDRLLEIISKIVDMTPQERSQLAHVLDYANISAITKTISMIKDRYKVVSQLKELIMDDRWGTTEAEIQEIVESHFWLFGEEFNLVTAEEPKFEEALRRFLYLMRGDGVTRAKPKIEHPDKNREMDIFACRKEVRSDSIDNIIVELKHPKVKLGRKELGQVSIYLDVVLQQPEFTASNMHWKVFLVGKSFDSLNSIKNAYETASGHGERYLVENLPSKRAKTYVLQWSDIFSEFECRHKYILDKLELDKTRIFEEMQKTKTKNDVVRDAVNNAAVETATWENPREPVGRAEEE